MPLHLPDDPPGRPVDERLRYYRMTTPSRADVVVSLGGSVHPVTLTVVRPHADQASARRVICLSYDEAWALWACLGDGLGVAGEPPDWVADSLDPTDVDGNPLPALTVADQV